MRHPIRTSVVLGGVLIAALTCTPGSTAPAPSSVGLPPPPPASPGVQLPAGATTADVAARVMPSVVNVFSERKADRPRATPFLSDPFFDHFFDLPRRPGFRNPNERERSLGSGVIVSSDGVILTNNHVVDRGDEIRVALHDGRELDAKIVGTDPESDVAVLRVDAKNLPAIEVADSSQIRVGDLVLAVGNPFGIGQTVTMGIISATGRANMGITDYEDFIQTDAAINPGNSGGALVDMNGRLIGINTAIVSRSGGYQGVGFAIPSNMALQVKDAILGHGKVMRGWLGVTIQNVTEDLAHSMNLQARRGVLVSDVTPGSPAAKAGIARGDVILSVNGHATNTSAQLRNRIAHAGKAARVTLEVERDRKPRTVEVTLGEIPNGGEGGPAQKVEGGLLGGITVQPLDRAARNRHGIPDSIEGVLVTKTDPSRADIGLREGDVIVEVNRKATTTVDAFRKAAKESDDGVLLLVYRDGATVFMSFNR
ncbi:MAG: DegQ family serine endoprotease [Deltaproteobacteria bacterium]|nr:DegQ family serine endoprotease [Kofleriaceae bacterium]